MLQGWVGSIPFGAIDRYAERYGITDIDEFDTFIERIGAMDAAWRKYTMDKMKASGG